MKKVFSTIVLLAAANYSFAQLLPADASTTDDKYRSGGIALGYLKPPVFAPYKFMVNGKQYLDDRLDIGTLGDYDDVNSNWGIKSSKAFLIASNSAPNITVQTATTTPFYAVIQAAIATGDYYFSNVSKAGDIVLKAHTSGSFIINNSRAGDIKFTTRPEFPAGLDQVRLLIDKDGNIGIGTETPDARLAVNGLIHAKEVKVDLDNWPDYVFDKNYDLPTIEETEKHIAENGYLINMPSAGEIEENGLEMGKMLKLQQEKIEELTLYIIQLNKEIQALKTKEASQ